MAEDILGGYAPVVFCEGFPCSNPLWLERDTENGSFFFFLKNVKWSQFYITVEEEESTDVS